MSHEAPLPRSQLLEGRRIAKALLSVVDALHTRPLPSVTPTAADGTPAELPATPAGTIHPPTLLFELFAHPAPGKSVIGYAFLDRYCAAIPDTWPDEDIRGLVAAFVAYYGQAGRPHSQLERLMQVVLIWTRAVPCDVPWQYEVMLLNPRVFS
jgi:hypothetical protein